jgi:hypothetical protein
MIKPSFGGASPDPPGALHALGMPALTLQALPSAAISL